VMQHRRDDSSWLIARLFARIAQVYSNTGLRTVVRGLVASVDKIASEAFERYCRLNYLTARSLAWPSQRLGIEALTEKRSFALLQVQERLPSRNWRFSSTCPANRATQNQAPSLSTWHRQERSVPKWKVA
jgi:hypothetical protein